MVTRHSNSSSVPAYPSNRPAYFANKFTRLLFRSCAANTIGHHAVLLLILIAKTEDSARYNRAVSYWNHQLESMLGFRSPKQLNLARKRAIEAGWLVHWRDHDRAVGWYFVVVPDCFGQIDECSEMDEGWSDLFSENGKQSGKPPNLELEDDSQLARLAAFLEGWNSISEDCGLKLVKSSKTPSKTLLAKWRELLADPNAAAAFRDIPALIDAIRQATFWHHRGSPATVELLFSRNSGGEWIAPKFLNGDYRKNDNGKRYNERHASLRYDPDRIVTGDEF